MSPSIDESEKETFQRKYNIDNIETKQPAYPFIFNYTVITAWTSTETLFCFCFKLILSTSSVKLLFKFTMVENWNRILLIKEYSLFNLVVKKDFSGKTMFNLYFFMARKYFTEIWIAVSYLALEAVLEWCSANQVCYKKLFYMQFWKLVPLHLYQIPLKNTYKKNFFFGRTESEKPTTLLEKDFLCNSFSRI